MPAGRSGIVLEVAQQVPAISWEELAHRARPTVLEHFRRSVLGPVLDERAQDGDGIAPLLRQMARDLARVRELLGPFDQSFILQISQSHGEHAGAQSLVVPQDVPESNVREERNIAKDEQRPSLSEDAQAGPDRTRVELYFGYVQFLPRSRTARVLDQGLVIIRSSEFADLPRFGLYLGRRTQISSSCCIEGGPSRSDSGGCLDGGGRTFSIDFSKAASVSQIDMPTSLPWPRSFKR
jgi:hypothetical protein